MIFVQNVQFHSMFGPFLHKMFGFTACLANFLLKILVLQHVWHDFCPKSWFYSMFGKFSGRSAGLGSGVRGQQALGSFAVSGIRPYLNGHFQMLLVHGLRMGRNYYLYNSFKCFMWKCLISQHVCTTFAPKCWFYSMFSYSCWKYWLLQHVWHNFCQKSGFYSMFGEFSGRCAGLGSGWGARRFLGAPPWLVSPHI